MKGRHRLQPGYTGPEGATLSPTSHDTFNPQSPEPRLLNCREACAYLGGVSLWHLRTMIHSEGLPVVRLGRRLLIDRVALDVWLDRRREERR